MILNYLIYLFLISLVSADEISVWEDYSLDVSCAADEGIYIESASWTYNMAKPSNMLTPNWRNYFYLIGKPFHLCTYDQTDIVRNLCQGKQHCFFKADRSILSSACNYWMKLDVNYYCRKCSQRKRSVDNLMTLNRGRYSRMVPDFVCDLTIRLPSLGNSCPNGRFTAKHVCSRCENSADGAAIFAIQSEFLRNNALTVQAHIHSVFMVNGYMAYTYNGNLCGFQRRASKYNCVRGAQRWNCNYIGEKIAYHDVNTGHYDPNNDTN